MRKFSTNNTESPAAVEQYEIVLIADKVHEVNDRFSPLVLLSVVLLYHVLYTI